MIKSNLFTRPFLRLEKLLQKLVFSKIISLRTNKRKLILYLMDGFLIYFSLLTLNIFVFQGESGFNHYFSFIDQVIIIFIGIFMFKVSGQYNGLIQFLNSQYIYQIFH